MSKSRCPWCNHNTVTAEGVNHYCNYCGYEWQAKPTVFDSITASPEVLAKELVYMVEYVRGFITVRKWTSNLIDHEYANFEEAFAATVAKLKEVCNGNC